MTSTPAQASCPSWCTSRHTSTSPYDDATHVRWENFSDRSGAPLVGIVQTPHGNRKPALLVGALSLDIDQAESMAGLLRQLGHADVAAAIRRAVAALDPGLVEQ